MLPLQPGWHDNDLFKMNQIERARVQDHVARKLGPPLKHSGSEVTAALGVHWAYEVSGVQPYTPTAAEKMVGNYRGKLDKKLVRGSADSEADFKQTAHDLAARRGHHVLMVNSYQCWPDVMGVS